MASAVVAGSTYLLAPPPPKSFPNNPLLASLLCHPLSHHPHLLLQLQRKDPSTRHAYPQFDLLGRKPARPSKSNSSSPTSTTSSVSSAASDVLGSGGRSKPREVTIQQSEDGDKVATIKYLSTLNQTQRRKAGLVPGDDSAIAVMYWNYSKQLQMVWTVHTYESRKRGGVKCSGYEFRLQGNPVSHGRDVVVRWIKKTYTSGGLGERDRAMTVTARRSSVSSEHSVTGPRRRHTMPPSSSSTTNSPSKSGEGKWEFSCPNARRIMATMTPQKLHIHSISSNATPLSSPSASSLDTAELHSDRELTPGKMMEVLIISALFVGLEDDFATKLRMEFLSKGGMRVPRDNDDASSEEYLAPSSAPPSPIKRSRTIPANQSTMQRRHSGIDVSSIEENREVLDEPKTPEPEITPAKEQQIVETKKMEPLLTLRGNLQPTSFYEKGWGLLTAVAATCMTKLMKGS